MKKILIIFFLHLLMHKTCTGQYRIKVIEEEDQVDQPSSTLPKKDLLLASTVNPNFTIQCSIDRNQWTTKNIRYRTSLEITLEDEYAYFFVRVCDIESQDVCVNYRLRPGKRYILKRDPESNRIIIKSGNRD